MKFSKRFFAVLIAFILVIPFAAACESKKINTESSVSEAESAEEISYESVEPSESKEECSEQEESSEPEESHLADESVIPEDTVVSFYACADNLVHPSVYYDAIENAAKANGTEPDYSDLHNAVYDFSPIYEFIADDIASADISYINQESLIGGDSRPISSYPRFNTPDAMGDAVAELGFDVVNVAHNHMLDSGNTDFLEYCAGYFTERGINVLGYYPNEGSTEDIMIIERKGIKVAFLTYTYSTNGIRNSSDSEFVIPYFDKALIEKQVAIAKEKADVVIVSAHWGNEYSYRINSMQEEYAEYLCELEVDVILGMHSHCIQPMEWKTSESGYKTLTVYSLGTMVSGIRKGMSALAGILTLDIVKDGETGEITIESPLFVPTILHYSRERSIAENDTASRHFKVYYLEDYTEELAKEHAILWVEKRDGVTTLEGGNFSKEALVSTVKKYINEEFLPDLE